MKQLRLVMIVVLAISVIASSIPAVGRAVAQPVAPRVAPLPQPAASKPIAERDFDTDWHLASGRPSVLGGCIYNHYGVLARQVRVGIEGLDAKGLVVASTSALVQDVPGGSYGHFEVPTLAGASNYRIRVLAYEWTQAR